MASFFSDKAMQLNSARFSFGRQRGFVPKPSFFDNPNFNPFVKHHLPDLDPLLINLQVICKWNTVLHLAMRTNEGVNLTREILGQLDAYDWTNPIWFPSQHLVFDISVFYDTWIQFYWRLLVEGICQNRKKACLLPLSRSKPLDVNLTVRKSKPPGKVIYKITTIKSVLANMLISICRWQRSQSTFSRIFWICHPQRIVMLHPFRRLWSRHVWRPELLGSVYSSCYVPENRCVVERC